MNGADVGESAACRNDRKRGAGLASKEEHAGVLPRRFRLLLGVVVDVVKNRETCTGVIDQSIERRHDDARIDVAVVRKERADPAERQGEVVRPVIPREDETGESSEGWMPEDVTDGVVEAEMRHGSCESPAYAPTPDPSSPSNRHEYVNIIHQCSWTT